MIKLPAKVKIGAHTYNVILYSFRERSDLCGQKDTSLGEIRIAEREPGGGPRKTADILHTFFHELLHAIDQTNCMRKIGGEDKEAVIDGIAEGLAQWFMDNDMPLLDGD